MNKRLALGLIGLNVLALAALTWFRLSAPATLPAPPPATPPRSAEEHYVTPGQLADAAYLADAALPPFTAVAHDGSTVAWQDLVASRPVVVVFIKSGCPCSAEFETYFQRLVRAYSPAVGFVGLIDDGPEAARRYAERNHVPYPVLADPERTVIRRFGARNGCAVALVWRGGTVHTLWPGYSADMLAEAGRRTAALAAVPERPLQTDDLPGALRAGCPFEP